MASSDQRMAGFLWTTCFLALACIGEARAQFGIDCTVPGYEQTLAEAKFPEKIEAAIRATCAFNKKANELHAHFGKGGWPLSLFPQFQQEVKNVEELGNRAAELNFAANDQRAFGNIKNIYIQIGSNKSWLGRAEEMFQAKQKRGRAATRPSTNYSTNNDTPGFPQRRQIGVGVTGAPCHLPTTPGC
jgi:hypothetical protein